MAILPGEPAPYFHARSDTNPRYSFNVIAGRNLVLTFIAPQTEGSEYLKQLSASPMFDSERAALFIVTNNSAGEKALPLRLSGVRAFFDDEREIAKLFDLDKCDSLPISFIISPRLQVIGLVTAPEEHHANAVLEIVERAPHVAQLPPMLAHPPVMIIPHVFEPELCEFLIAGYKADGGRDSGFMRDVDGRTVEIKDSSHKVRRDWNIEKGNKAIIDTIQDRFLKRVIPEIKKAYQFDVTRMERYIVSCYNADDGGHFNAHRDNTTKGTAHRRFAVSVNLNADEYDGGDLRFREFGMQTYRPPTGGCCIFSCSLLHEATPVTKGVRYAFLPFLYDEAARKVREENLKYFGDERSLSS
jgi:predicted 2-oxoglutarate/Fe(II)-dependent dioxygenase YbiX